MSLAVTALLFFTLASPGPIDRNGGHVDIMNGQYHTHAGPSYQSRYLDVTGRIWTGQGPRPEEYLIFTGADNADLFGDTWFFFLSGSIIAVSVVLGLDIRKRLGYRHYHHRVVARDHEEPAARPAPVRPRWLPVPANARSLLPVLAPPTIAQRPWSGSERRSRVGERRRHVR